MKKIISNCPVCSEELVVKTLSCSNCHTEITGEFKLSKFNYLNDEQLYFIEVFTKNRGSIKAVERELNISYPTVKKYLDDVILALGYQLEDEDSIDGEAEHSTVNVTDTAIKRFKKIRIVVIDNGVKKVNLQIPLEFISVLGEKNFRLDKKEIFKENNIDFKQIIEMANKGMTGELLHIETDEGKVIIISVE